MPEGAPDPGGVPLDAVVERLAPEGLPDPALSLLVGVPGTSSGTGWKRLYIELDARQFVEVRESDVVLEQRIEVGTSREEQIALWVRRGADVVRGGADTDEAQRELLRGPMLSTSLSGSFSALIAVTHFVGAAATARSCYHQCATGRTACDIVLCTLPGFGCAVSQAPDICV